LTPWAVWGHPQLSGRDVATFWSPMVPVSGLLRVYSHHNPVLFTPPPGFVHTYFYFSCCEHVEGGGVNRGVLTARSSAGEGGAHVVDAVSALDGRRTMPWSRMASTGASRLRRRVGRVGRRRVACGVRRAGRCHSVPRHGNGTFPGGPDIYGIPSRPSYRWA
jgi:hypothetical protein